MAGREEQVVNTVAIGGGQECWDHADTIHQRRLDGTVPEHSPERVISTIAEHGNSLAGRAPWRRRSSSGRFGADGRLGGGFMPVLGAGKLRSRPASPQLPDTGAEQLARRAGEMGAGTGWSMSVHRGLNPRRGLGRACGEGAAQRDAESCARITSARVAARRNSTTKRDAPRRAWCLPLLARA